MAEILEQMIIIISPSSTTIPCSMTKSLDSYNSADFTDYGRISIIFLVLLQIVFGMPDPLKLGCRLISICLSYKKMLYFKSRPSVI